MPFELGAKKAGLSLVRAFLHSVEGARPYLTFYLVLSQKQSEDATLLATSSRAIVMEKFQMFNVKLFLLSCRDLRRCFPMPRRQEMIDSFNN
jgi:hypothetical protein